jgi:hypothetical protein
MPQSEALINSLEGFLQTVWTIQKSTQTEIRLFRGQARDKEWPLLPKLFRPPNTVEQVRKFETKLLSKFKNDSPYLLPTRPTNDWDWLSLGQHYSLSTRLLDWTANPLTALFLRWLRANRTSQSCTSTKAPGVKSLQPKKKRIRHPSRLIKADC